MPMGLSWRSITPASMGIMRQGEAYYVQTGIPMVPGVHPLAMWMGQGAVYPIWSVVGGHFGRRASINLNQVLGSMGAGYTIDSTSTATDAVLYNINTATVSSTCRVICCHCRGNRITNVSSARLSTTKGGSSYQRSVFPPSNGVSRACPPLDPRWRLIRSDHPVHTRAGFVGGDGTGHGGLRRACAGGVASLVVSRSI